MPRLADSRTDAVPTIVFGAFDRHNFGDMLFVHIAAALLPGKSLVFAGLAARDLRRWGGHRLVPLASLAQSWRDRPVRLLHAGGELLACDVREAALMLLPHRRAQAMAAQLAPDPDRWREALGWAQRETRSEGLLPYAGSHRLFPAGAIGYAAVGGADLAGRDPALREEALAKLREADAVSVRDELTLALARSAGIDAALLPDPAVMAAQLFAGLIRTHLESEAMRQLQRAMPQGYAAVQFSADFGDDATLDVIARELDRFIAGERLGVVLFRAGAALWHDDLAVYRRLTQRMESPVTICRSLHLWDICALLAGARLFAGSSLHGRIVAMAHAIPRISLRPLRSSHLPSKHGAVIGTWDAALPAMVEPPQLGEGMAAALHADADGLRARAEDLPLRYRKGFEALCGKLDRALEIGQGG